MTPKEQARQLCTDMAGGDSDYSACCEVAKYALIAVDNTISALFEYDGNTEEYLKEEFPDYFSCELQNMDRDLNYWQKVKQEIEKL